MNKKDLQRLEGLLLLTLLHKTKGEWEAAPNLPRLTQEGI